VSTFVDSSAFYAAADSGDTQNARAKAILADGGALMTSDHVLVECWLLIRHRQGRDVAERWWSALRSGVALIETVGSADLDVAWEIGREFPDQDFSLVDRTSFAVMRRLGLTRVASFDDHFAIYRYGRARERALEVLR